MSKPIQKKTKKIKKQLEKADKKKLLVPAIAAAIIGIAAVISSLIVYKKIDDSKYETEL